MSFKYWMLCITLFIIVLFLAIESYDALTHPLNLTDDKGAARKSETRRENSSATGVVTKPTFAAAASHNLIAEKNIFNPERKDFQGTGPGSASNAVTRPQVILYGITIAGDYRSASMISPGRALKKGERDLMTLKLGERIGEYKLTKVLSDRITLEAQGDAFEVLLYDPKVPRKREGGPPGAISSASTPTTGTPGPFVRRETAQGSKESLQDKIRPSQIPSPIPTPTQVPGSAPTPMPEPVLPSASPLTTPGLTPTPIPGPTPTPIPGPAPTPTQVPPSMIPTPIVPPFTPTLAAPPPGMGGQSVPIPSGMGQPVPVPPGAPMQPPSSSGN